MTTTANTHPWCELCANSPDLHEIHETAVVKAAGMSSATIANPRVLLQVSYADGDRGPQLYIGADEAGMTIDQAEELYRRLGEQIQLMRTVQTTPAMAVTR